MAVRYRLSTSFNGCARPVLQAFLAISSASFLASMSTGPRSLGLDYHRIKAGTQRQGQSTELKLPVCKPERDGACVLTVF
jgi:hypothetical protein